MNIRVLKVAECLSLSGKSTLSYEVGVDEANSVLIRVSKNSNNGYFTPEWVKVEALISRLEAAKKPLSSYALSGSFKCRSANLPGFVFAVLYKEGIVERNLEDSRCYDICDQHQFNESTQALIKAGVDIKTAISVDQQVSSSKSQSTKKKTSKKVS